MISYVTGSLGMGKSTYGARKAGHALLSGRVVASNMGFVEGWEQIVLKRSPYYRFAGKKSRMAQERELRRRFFYSAEVGDVIHARVRGRGEGRGIMILDETHNAINNREWQQENQKNMLRVLTLARKRGWRVYVISQHKDNTDAAIRRIAADEIRVVNWKRLLRIPVLGVPVLPFHFFLALTYPMNLPAYAKDAGKQSSSEAYFHGWTSRLFDTFEDFGAEHEGEGSVWLPLSAQADVDVAAGGPRRGQPAATEAAG